MIGPSKTRTNKLILFGLALCFLCFILASVEAYSSLKYHKRFAKHLYKFVKKEKNFFKKKGIEAAALMALTNMGKKKMVPIPLPLPIPIVHQPIIHEPFFLPPFGKFAAKGMAMDALAIGKGAAALGGLGGMGGMGGMGGIGGLGGLGGMGGLGLGGLGLGGGLI